MIQARAILPALLGFLETVPGAERSDHWLKSARTALALDLLLEEPVSSGEHASLSRDQLEQLGRVLLEKTSELRNLLAELIRPYSSQSVQRLIAQCQENLPEAHRGQEVEALLQTPFLSSSDRQELWIAGLELEHRLGELPPQDNVSTTDPDASSERMASVTKLVGLRNDRLFALRSWQIQPRTTKSRSRAKSPVRMRSPRKGTGAARPEAPWRRFWPGPTFHNSRGRSIPD